MRAVNLLPKDIGKQRRVTAQNAPVLVGSGLAVVVTLVLALSFLSASGNVRKAQDDLNAANAELAATPVPPAAPTAEDTALANEKSARVTALASAIGARVAWDRVLREFSLVLPDDVWLTSLQLKSGGDGTAASQNFSISGYTYSHDGVARLLSRLSLIPELSTVTLSSSQKQAGANGTVQFTIGAAMPSAAPAPAPAPVAPVPTSTDTSATTTTPAPTS